MSAREYPVVRYHTCGAAQGRDDDRVRRRRAGARAAVGTAVGNAVGISGGGKRLGEQRGRARARHEVVPAGAEVRGLPWAAFLYYTHGTGSSRCA